MSRDGREAQTRRVPVEVLSSALVHTLDAIELPPADRLVVGRAERRDSYPIVVTRSPEETIERLLRVVGDARVAVITDETVAALYGPLVVGALEKGRHAGRCRRRPRRRAAQDARSGP